VVEQEEKERVTVAHQISDDKPGEGWLQNWIID
jgi:hypothetical protein